MEYTVTGTAQPFDLGAGGADEILQNVRVILTTVAGTVPMNRAFGLDMSSVDEPVELAQARMTPVIIEAVRQFEPRAEVVKVSYEQTEAGTLVPRVELRLREVVQA